MSLRHNLQLVQSGFYVEGVHSVHDHSCHSEEKGSKLSCRTSHKTFDKNKLYCCVSIYYFHPKKNHTQRDHNNTIIIHLQSYARETTSGGAHAYMYTHTHARTHARTYTHTYAAVSFQNSNDSYYNHWRINNAAQILTNDTHFPPKIKNEHSHVSMNIFIYREYAS